MNQTQTHVRNCLAAVDSVVLGKAQVTRLAFATLLARGSILIEDRPGIGKTTLAKALASVLGLSFQRIQCTNDLLPMDILGRLDYTHSASPGLIKGPIFASIVLLDELNRAPPRTQSAFLQAMEEGEVTLEGQTFALPKPQMFIATQNPSDQIGTTLLPESELDRFTIRISLGFPDPASEKVILKFGQQDKLSILQKTLEQSELLELQEAVAKITVSDSILELVVRFLNYSRSKGAYLSPRAGKDLVRVSQAIAFLNHQQNVLPEDVKSSMKAVIEHRVRDCDALISGFSFQA